MKQDTGRLAQPCKREACPHPLCWPCRHKNIITFYGVVNKPNEVLLVTEVSSALLPSSDRQHSRAETSARQDVVDAVT